MGLNDATDSDASTDSFGALLNQNPAMVNTEARIPTAHSTILTSRLCGLGAGSGAFVCGLCLGRLGRLGRFRLPMISGCFRLVGVQQSYHFFNIPDMIFDARFHHGSYT